LSYGEYVSPLAAGHVRQRWRRTGFIFYKFLLLCSLTEVIEMVTPISLTEMPEPHQPFDFSAFCSGDKAWGVASTASEQYILPVAVYNFAPSDV
jgi:hypothetical protein